MIQKIRKQSRVEGGRAQLSAAFISALEKEVQRQAKMFNASRSFVIATAVAEAFGISEQEDYRFEGNVKVKTVRLKKASRQ